jgi:steroid delta-isomerase-like uncharacterized protein
MNDPKQIMEQFMEAITSHNLDKMEEMLHESYTYESSDGQMANGPKEGIARYRSLINAFPDMHMELRNELVSGNFVVSEFINHATHTGELNGIMPTNRTIKLPSCNICETREGKIYADRDYFDNALLMQQLGVEIGMEHHV